MACLVFLKNFLLLCVVGSTTINCLDSSKTLSSNRYETTEAADRFERSAIIGKEKNLQESSGLKIDLANLLTSEKSKSPIYQKTRRYAPNYDSESSESVDDPVKMLVLRKYQPTDKSKPKGPIYVMRKVEKSTDQEDTMTPKKSLGHYAERLLNLANEAHKVINANPNLTIYENIEKALYENLEKAIVSYLKESFLGKLSNDDNDNVDVEKPISIDKKPLTLADVETSETIPTTICQNRLSNNCPNCQKPIAPLAPIDEASNQTEARKIGNDLTIAQQQSVLLGNQASSSSTESLPNLNLPNVADSLPIYKLPGNLLTDNRQQNQFVRVPSNGHVPVTDVLPGWNNIAIVQELGDTDLNVETAGPVNGALKWGWDMKRETTDPVDEKTQAETSNVDEEPRKIEEKSDEKSVDYEKFGESLNEESVEDKLEDSDEFQDFSARATKLVSIILEKLRASEQDAGLLTEVTPDQVKIIE